MYVVCSTLCFGRLKLDDALRHIREMHFAKADLAIHHDGPHLTPAEVTADPGKVAQRLRVSNLGFAGFHLTFAELDGPVVRDQLRGVCRLARMLAANLTPEQLIREAWLLCLGRLPTDREKSEFVSLLAGAAPDEKQQVAEDIFWSLLTSREFLFQH